MPIFDTSSWTALQPAFNEHIKSPDALVAWEAADALIGLLQGSALTGLPPEPTAHALLGALRRHPKDGRVQLRGCKALHRLCRKFAELRATLQRDPSVYATVRAAAEVAPLLEKCDFYRKGLWLQPPSGYSAEQPGATGASPTHQSDAKAEQNLQKAIALKDIHAIEAAIETAEANGVEGACLLKAYKVLRELQKAERTKPASPEAMKADTPHGLMEIPSHWSKESLDQGWMAVPVKDRDTLASLEEMFTVQQPKELGKGRDANKYDRPYNQLRLHCAWRIEHLNRWKKYVIEREDVLRHARQLERQSIGLKSWKSKLEDSGRKLPGQLIEEAGERFFLHGTSPKHILAILHEGFSEKLASLKGAFGAGNYFAEDPEKIDQYTTPDPGFEAAGFEDLHSRLYRAGGNAHPGDDIFYCFVVRVACGACLHTEGLDRATSLKDISTGEEIFLNADRRELRRIPGASPPFSYDTLVVNVGSAVKRFREIISFSGHRVYAEYLLAYHRI